MKVETHYVQADPPFKPADIAEAAHSVCRVAPPTKTTWPCLDAISMTDTDGARLLEYKQLILFC